ncbi:SEC14-like protein 2 [Trichonephila clavipes]|nr:SEC14-like protein 2 [Trichonephila clavipes]
MRMNVDEETYNDTYLFYSFLKGKYFDVDEAENMLSKSLKWRKKMKLDTIEQFVPPEAIRNYFERNRIGFDKNGGIIHYIPIGKVDVKGMYMSAKFPDLERTLLQIIEEDVKISKTKRKTPNGPYPSTLHIFDMEGLTFANATDKKGIEYMILGLTIFQNHYPVLIGSVYVINISSYFMIPCSIVKSCLSPASLEKIHLMGTDDWKEALLRVIDADVLPGFLGGTRTDPDGNSLCKTIVIPGGKIDDKYYIHKSKNSLVNSPGAKKLVLARASFSEIELEIEEDGSLIEWEFETKTRDIGFGVYYKKIENGEEQMVELVPLLRIDTEDYSETGVYRCENAGTRKERDRKAKQI